MLTTGQERSTAEARADTRKRIGTKPSLLWDGVRDDGADMRFSFLPGRAADDLALSCVHFRVLAYPGRFNHKKGWCRLSQTDLAERFGVRRQAVNKAVRELVDWGYLEKRSQRESGESFCLYRTVIDRQDDARGVSATPDTPPDDGVSATADTGVSPRRTPVSPLRTPNSYRSFDVVDEEGISCDQTNPSGTDGAASAGRLPFSAAIIRDLAAMPGDIAVDALIERYFERTAGKRINDPSAYLLEMGKDVAAKTLGISRATLRKISSRNSSERAAAFAGEVGTFSKPSDEIIARARRRRDPNVEAALKHLAGKTFASQSAANKAFDGALTMLRFTSPRRAA